MNLATGCSNCGTLFRVVEDQLKVSDGWVRCGHCHAVFNALESLVDLDLEPLSAAAPAQAPEPPEAAAITPPPAAGSVPLPSPPPPAPSAEAGPLRGPLPPAPTAAAEPGRVASGPSAAPLHDDDRDHVLIGPSTFAAAVPPAREPDLDLDLLLPGDPAARREAAPAPAPLPARPPLPAAEPLSGVAASDDAVGAPLTSVLDAPLPAFAADRPAFARAPGVARRERTARAGWAGALAALLAVALAGQWLHHERAMLAARYPVLQPALASWCATLGCRVELPLSIDDLSVESTGLAQTALPGAFRLTVALRNRAAVALAVPAVELSLSDTGGQLIARKVLMPNDFDKPPPALPPGGDTTLQALLATPGGRVSGYTVEVYYP